MDILTACRARLAHAAGDDYIAGISKYLQRLPQPVHPCVPGRRPVPDHYPVLFRCVLSHSLAFPPLCLIDSFFLTAGRDNPNQLSHCHQKTKTAAARTVVWSFVFRTQDCVMFLVPTILPLILNSSFFSSQLSSTLKSMPSVEASIAAAKSSA